MGAQSVVIFCHFTDQIPQTNEVETPFYCFVITVEHTVFPHALFQQFCHVFLLENIDEISIYLQISVVDEIKSVSPVNRYQKLLGSMASWSPRRPVFLYLIL